MLRRVLARLGHVLDLAQLFELPDRHPDRMIAASIVLYVGLAIIVAITMWNYWNATHREVEAFKLLVAPFSPVGYPCELLNIRAKL
jgi:hypothetical protein